MWVQQCGVWFDVLRRFEGGCVDVVGQVMGSNRPLSYFELQMLRKGGEAQGQQGNQIQARIHSILSTVPVMLVFRGLGFVHDRHILSHIVYDFTDGEMLERLRWVWQRVVLFEAVAVGLRCADTSLSVAPDVL